MPATHLQTLTKHTDRVWTLAWNPSGTVLASSGSDKKICLWSKEADVWNCVAILDNSHEKSIRRICWSPCGQYIASASFDSTVCIWKKNQQDRSWAHHFLMTLEGHESEVKSVAWSHDGQFLASCGRDRTIWIWERATDTDPDSEDPVENWDCSDVKIDHTKDVKHIVWHPKFNILASCSYDDTVKLFHKDGHDWKCFETLSSHTSTVWSADFSASGEFLVTSSDDRTVRIWKNRNHNKLPLVEQNSWKCVSVIQGYHGRTIYDVSWSKLDDVIVSASGDNSLSFYKQSTAEDTPETELFVCIERHCQSHECDVNVVAWNPKIPGLLASGSDDRLVKLWNYSTPKGMKQLATITDEILANLRKTCISDDSSLASAITRVSENTRCELTFNITDFSTLMNLIQNFQNLQNEVARDVELRDLELLFDLKIADWNLPPVGFSNLTIDDKDGSVGGFIVNVVDTNGESKYKFRLVIDRARFNLSLPRRSIKFMVIANELFLIEKTGDMYKVLPSGKSEFLLGHLFTFSDIRFMTNNNKSEIRYVISSDRDEKIRISKYPATYEIERYCFWHKSAISKLVLVDDKRFISIDQDKLVTLWNLSDLGQDNKPIKPERTESLGGNIYKRIKT